MSKPHRRLTSLQQYFILREQSDDILEYIDGVVLMTPSPSTQHQRISGRLSAKLFHYLEGKDCEVFSAPYDIHLKKEDMDVSKVLIPDISVICDKRGIEENRFVGVPKLIIEILSPSNQAHDLVTKLNIYMEYGVQEYWIVNPMLKAIQVYVLNADGLYEQTDALSTSGDVASKTLPNFRVKLEEIFAM
ncbi:Uma2 family endonuclease [Paenibacillus koleovorans]|uniref:Uma2 family endonuclease n=1 Tax=Paenibacillus koleovorans TaxID=121608 RepID=UPI000FD76E50|nr:Uma2 family endonuclease [Paenibacillus koleovorans]